MENQNHNTESRAIFFGWEKMRWIIDFQYICIYVPVMCYQLLYLYIFLFNFMCSRLVCCVVLSSCLVLSCLSFLLLLKAVNLYNFFIATFRQITCTSIFIFILLVFRFVNGMWQGRWGRWSKQKRKEVKEIIFLWGNISFIAVFVCVCV